ncbi:hypothetical protein LTR94_029286, partial [Friedmanniomyces endolithicus]
RRGGGGGAAVRQLGGQPVARPVRPLGGRAQPPHRRGAARALPGRTGDRLSERGGGQAARLCRRDRGRRDRAGRDGRPRLGRCRPAHRAAGAGQSRSAGAAGRGRGAGPRDRPRAGGVPGTATRLQSGPRDRAAYPDRACRAPAGAGRACDLRDLLDGGAVHAAALSGLSSGRDERSGRGGAVGRSRDQAAPHHPDAGDDRGMGIGAVAGRLAWVVFGCAGAGLASRQVVLRAAAQRLSWLDGRLFEE